MYEDVIGPRKQTCDSDQTKSDKGACCWRTGATRLQKKRANPNGAS